MPGLPIAEIHRLVPFAFEESGFVANVFADRQEH